MTSFSHFAERIFGKMRSSASKDVRPCDKDHVGRPSLCLQMDGLFSWSYESVLFLGLGEEFVDIPFVDLARELSNRGASVSFWSLTSFNDVYQIPLEKFTMVIMDDCSIEETFGVMDVGGALRRADAALVLVWASPAFTVSAVADQPTKGFCDVILALPSDPEKLALFLA